MTKKTLAKSPLKPGQGGDEFRSDGHEATHLALRPLCHASRGVTESRAGVLATRSRLSAASA